jgi:protein-disulfide isomerase
MKKQIIILIIIGLVVVGGGILLLTLANPETSRNGDSSQVVDSALLVKGDSHMTGQTNAKVTFVEFGDYQCPACALVAPMIKNVLSEYKDNKDVNFVYRHYPLPQHTNAVPAAMAAEAAGEQGKYWEMHDRLYENQKDWERLAKTNGEPTARRKLGKH